MSGISLLADNNNMFETRLLADNNNNNIMSETSLHADNNNMGTSPLADRL